MRKKRTYAPRLLKGHTRQRCPAQIDPLHRSEVRTLARMTGTTESFVVDEILTKYFKMHSPRYGEEY